MNEPTNDRASRVVHNFLYQEFDLCPDCQEAYMDELIDETDGHSYLLCPNIDCRAKIWVSNFDDEDE